MSTVIPKATVVVAVIMAISACTDQTPTGSSAAFPPAAQASNGQACASAPPGLVSWWPGEGNANDAVGSNHGTLQNGTNLGFGLVGQAFSLDGIDDHVDIPNSPALTPPSNSITLDAWIKPNVVSGGRAIVTKYGLPGVSWVLMVLDGHIRFGVYQSGSVDLGRVFDTVNPVISTGIWQHVAMTFDVATQALTLYVDGVVVPSIPSFAQTQGDVTTIRDSDTPVRIGALQIGTGSIDYLWDGLIDEVDLFDRALTSAEIQAIVSAGNAGKCGGVFNHAPLAAPGSNGPAGYSGLEGTLIGFDGTGSSDPDGDALAFSWNFGDNATGTGATAAHAYADNGSYTASLTVSDGRGGSDTKPVSVAVTNVAPTVTGFTSPSQVALNTGAAQITNVTFTDPAGALDAPFVTSIACGNQTMASGAGVCTYSAPGVYTIAVRVTDKDGGVSTAKTATVAVTFAFGEFLQPVDNLPTINVAKAGSAIPVKFSLGGDYGLAILSAGYPMSGPTVCDPNAPTDDIETTATAGNSTLNYDSTTQTYVYIWKTDKAWAGSCRQLVVKLIDGTEHRALFQLK